MRFPVALGSGNMTHANWSPPHKMIAMKYNNSRIINSFVFADFWLVLARKVTKLLQSTRDFTLYRRSPVLNQDPAWPLQPWFYSTLLWLLLCSAWSQVSQGVYHPSIHERICYSTPSPSRDMISMQRLCVQMNMNVISIPPPAPPHPNPTLPMCVKVVCTDEPKITSNWFKPVCADESILRAHMSPVPFVNPRVNHPEYHQEWVVSIPKLEAYNWVFHIHP